jgi:hypothetical protein
VAGDEIAGLDARPAARFCHAGRDRARRRHGRRVHPYIK